MYIQQLQYNPHTFIYQIEDICNESLLELLVTSFYTNKEMFDNIIYFCGQESIKYRDLHPYNKVLNILRDRHIDSFNYVCFKLLSGILMFQLDNNAELINITISNLCVYPVSLHNALLFLNHNNKMNQLLDLIKNQKELIDYIIQVLYNIDLELGSYIQEYSRLEIPEANNIEDVEDVGKNNNIKDGNRIGNSNNNQELNIEELEEENDIVNETINDKINNVEEYDSYIDSLDEDRKNVISIAKTKDNDRFIVQSSNEDIKRTKVLPSIELLEKCLGDDILYKMSQRKIDYLKFEFLEPLIREQTDNDIIFCDGMNLLYCNKNLTIDDNKNLTIDGNKNLTKKERIQNLDLWIELFNNIKYQKNDDMSDSGHLLDKYSVVITVQNYIFDKLFGASSVDNINMAVENNIVILGIGNNEADDYLLYYLLMKIGRSSDILFTNDNYEWAQHNLKFFINNKTMELKDFETNKKSDLELLMSDFRNTHQGYTFSL